MTRIVSLTPLAVERDSRTFKQAASMARLGYESIVVEAEPSEVDRDHLPFELITVDPPETAAAYVRAVGVAGWLAPPPLGWWISYLWRWALVSAPAIPPASLYYLHSFRLYPAVHLARRRQGTPFIYDAHDFYQAIYSGRPLTAQNPTRMRWPMRRFLLSVERRCARHAAEVVITSEGYGDLFEAEFGRRPVVIPNAHDTRIDEDPPVALREELGLDSRAMLIALAGNDQPGIAIEATIEAIERLPDNVHLALIGTGYEPYAAQIESRSLGGRVHRLPPVPPNQYAPFISSADLAIIPYFASSPAYRPRLPNRFFVPIAAGVPVLYPEQLTEMARLAEAHEVGLPIDAQRPESVVSAVRQVLGDEALLARLRQNALRAGEVLSWESHEERLGELVETCLSRS
jgi:glycosyl transferase family 4/glycosyl transferase family 1